MSPNVQASVGSSRKARKAATRAALKAAAQACFEKRGFAATGIGDVARAAGVAHGTFYVHFESKEAVLEELLGEFNDELVRRLGPIAHAAESVPLSTTVRDTAGVFLDYWQERRDFVACYAEGAVRSFGIAQLRDGVNPPMLTLLRHALRAPLGLAGTTDANVDLVAHGLLALWLRLGMQYLFNEAVSREAALDSLVRMTLGAIAAVSSSDGDAEANACACGASEREGEA